MKRPRFETNGSSPERLQTLADGVFAIVMTLLVFRLGVPAADEISGNAELVEALGRMWPEFLIYVLSFLVLGVFWLIHHMIFESIGKTDTTLVWLNIVFLMFAALIPFTTALVGEHGAEPITALVYGLNMLLIFDMGWATFSYVTRNRRLQAGQPNAELERGARRMGLVYTLCMVPALAISFVSPTVAFVVYGTIVVAFIGFTVVGWWEVVTVWPAAAGEKVDPPDRR
jgi:uncharacterized membrane protein